MKIKVLFSIILSFIVLMTSVILIILAAYTKSLQIMYAGLGCLILASLGYAILILFGLRYWLKSKTEVK